MNDANFTYFYFFFVNRDHANCFLVF